MPSSKEVIANKPLSGSEIRAILHQKLDLLVNNEGLLTHYVAYGRIGFTLTLQLHLDNMMRSESSIDISSAPVGRNVPELAALETPPLADPSPEAVIAGTALDYRIDSPNTERLRHELPVTMNIKQQDGTTTQQTVHYPKDNSLGDGDLTIRDISKRTQEKWKK
jgi:hypothetical protein